ncbi:MAG: helix-turn-helix domain-containing protein [Candidatus Thorarchaeota archaeon]|jgi:predicted DNA-binding protein (UPF0251 family)
MRDSSEVDEIDEDVSDRLFSLHEIMSESEVEEVEADEKVMSEEERAELLREVHDSVKVISPGTGEEIDPEEVCRLYKDGMSLKKVGEHFGFKTGAPIKRILESEGVQVRQGGAQGENLDPDEVLRLYLEEGLSLKKIGEQFGLKSGNSIKRILKIAGIEPRPVGFQEIEIDPDELDRLYFGEGMSLNECAEHFQCKSTDPILRVFREEGWKTRYQETYEKEIDPKEVFRLYDEGMSIRKIGDHFGVSYGRIHREFMEHGKEYSQEIQVDPDVIHRLYFGKGLSRDETGEVLGVSRTVIDRIFEEQEWEKRPIGFQPVEIDLDEFKRLYYEEELEVDKIAEQLQVSERTIIRFRQEQGLEERRKSLLKLNPDDWAALCVPCHRVTHSLMRAYDFDWSQVEKKVKDILGKMSFRQKLKGALSKRF